MTEPSKRKASASGGETRARIVTATLDTLRDVGIVGTSARAIARAGDFNQALIFYHFDSVDGAVIAAVGEMSRARIERHRTRLEEAETLVQLIDVAALLNEDDLATGNMSVLTQAFAGAARNPEMGPQLYALLTPWSDMVSDAIKRVIGSSVVASVVPHDDLAQMISALFLGIELLDNLDPEHANAATLLSTLRSLATMLEVVLDSPMLSMFTPPSDE